MKRLVNPSTLRLFFMDLAVLAGVLWFGWDPLRAVLFYWIDGLVLIAVYSWYRTRKSASGNTGSVIMAFSVVFFVFLLYAQLLFSMATHLGLAAPAELDIRFFRPYHEVALFLAISAWANINHGMRLMLFPFESVVYPFSIYTFGRMFMLPLMVLLLAAGTRLGASVALSLVLSLLVLRNTVEWLYRHLLHTNGVDIATVPALPEE